MMTKARGEKYKRKGSLGNDKIAAVECMFVQEQRWVDDIGPSQIRLECGMLIQQISIVGLRNTHQAR